MIVFDLLNTGDLSGMPMLGLRVGVEVGFESESPLLVCIEAIREEEGAAPAGTRDSCTFGVAIAKVLTATL